MRHVAEDCSKHELRPIETTDRSPIVDSRVRRTISDESEAERRRLQASRSVVRRRSLTRYDGAVPCRQLYTRRASLKSIRSGALRQPSSSPTEAVGGGTSKYRPGLHCHNPDGIGRVMSPMTGERIWEVTGGHFVAGTVLRSRQRRSF